MPSATMTQAVVAVYQTLAAAHAGPPPTLPQQLWFEEAPETNIQLPIAQYQHQGEPPIASGYPTGAPKPVMLDGRFQIVFWHNDLVAMETGAKLIMNAFSPDSIAITGAHTTTFRTNYQLAATRLRDANGKPVWTATISYLVKVGNPPA